MIKQEWKSKRETTIDIRKVIDDYEAKLCMLHTENLNLKQDIERYKSDLERQITAVKRAEDVKDMWYQKAQRLDKQMFLLKKHYTAIITTVRAKWWNRFTMSRLLQLDVIQYARF